MNICSDFCSLAWVPTIIF